jgi:hypothetical protein
MMPLRRYQLSVVVPLNPMPSGYAGRKTACFNILKNVYDTDSVVINQGKANQETPLLLVETVEDTDVWLINFGVLPESPGFIGRKTAFENVLREVRNFGTGVAKVHVCNHRICKSCTNLEDV